MYKCNEIYFKAGELKKKAFKQKYIYTILYSCIFRRERERETKRRVQTMFYFIFDAIIEM